MTKINPPAILTVLVLLAAAGSVYAFQNNFFGLLPQSLESRANAIIAECAHAENIPVCYDTEIPGLMDDGLTMEQTFQVTSLIQSKTDGYFYCHVLGHELAGKETAKDPSKWTEVIARCPTDMCSYGCLHGAAAARFSKEYLTPTEITAAIPQIADICESSAPGFTELERATCYHALGHLGMYMSNADVPTALHVCDEVTSMNKREDLTQICYDGVFMQIFQPLGPDDVSLVAHIPAKTKTDTESFCARFPGLVGDTCHSESWPLYYPGLLAPGAVASFCGNRSDATQTGICYNNIFYILVAELNFDVGKLTDVCESVPAERKGQCFGNTASRFVETDARLTPKAVSLCETASRDGVGDRCYKELLFYSTYNYQIGSEGFKAVCNAFPEPWKTSCLKGDGTDTHFNTISL